MKWKRWLGILLAAAAVAAALVYGFRPQPVSVEAAEVRFGPMRVTIEEEGKTRVADRYVVSAPAAGVVLRPPWKVGDVVKAGETLFRLQAMRAAALDPRSRAEAEARVGVAGAALRAAEQRLEAAGVDAAYWRRELARLRPLAQSGDVARERLDRTATEVERAEAALSTARRNIEVAQSELEAARATLTQAAAPANGAPAETVAVQAPVAGRVMKLIQESEAAVQAGAAIVEIGNTRALEVEVELLSADAVKVAPGMRVQLERWGGDRPLEGRVRRVEPTAFTKVSALGVEEQRVLTIVDIVSPGEVWQRLGSGYRVEAHFVLWENDRVLQAPASALFRHGEGWAAFVIEGGTTRRREVRIGRRNGLTAEVQSGLAEGERVIAHPDDTVEEGKAVRVR